MRSQNNNPLWRIAEQIADCFADGGYAFIEDDKIEGLAAVLQSFLTVADIPVNMPRIEAQPHRSVGLREQQLVGSPLPPGSHAMIALSPDQVP